MGVGIVARNYRGEVLGVKCLTKPFIIDLITAEAVGVRETVAFCQQMGFSNIIMEGDSLEVIHELTRDDNCGTSYGMMINDTKLGLLTIPTWEINHVKQGANIVAHILAKQALVLSEDIVWMRVSPVCIQGYVAHDSFISDE
jgi:hypothetical protein